MFNILFQNIQSSFSKQDTLEIFLKEKPFQAVCISETWLTKEKLPLFQVDGYAISASYCRRSRRGGGVLILTKGNIETLEVTDITDMSIDYVLELCAVEIKYLNLLIITMYWNGREEDKFYQQLKIIMNYVNNKYTKYRIVVGGDFNINILTNSSKSMEFLNLMLEYRFVQQINTPTRVTSVTCTCLDLIFTNFVDPSFSTTVEDHGLSDHKSTMIKIKIRNHQPPTVWYTCKRHFRENNVKNFKLDVRTINWSELLSKNKNINQNYHTFNEIILNKLNFHFPKRKVKIKSDYKKSWLTVGIKKSSRNKRLLKALIQTTDNTVIKKHYKLYEKSLKTIINTSKRNQYINRMTKSKNKTKTMWKIIKERTNKTITKYKQNITLKINNNVITEPKTIANYFSKYFISMGESSLPSGGFSSGDHLPVATSIENTMFLSPTSTVEVCKIIKSLKNKFSCGIDEIPPTLFKQCAEELAFPLCFLINQSFTEGTYPDLLKQTIIKPLYKKNSPYDPTNYRPIALLPTASKIFEKVMCKRVYCFCEKYKIFDESQNGFRKNRSTTLAVFKYMQQVLDILNRKKYAVGILLDMSKAYDRVQHNILLRKLNQVGIRGEALRWFRSYLESRPNYVDIEHFDHSARVIRSVRSEMCHASASIPQGSVVGCLLFLIYINDLPKVVEESCVLFADDISVLAECQNEEKLTENLHGTLDSITKWLRNHNLEVNFIKTKTISFNPHQKRPLNLSLNYRGAQIENVNAFDLLGIVIDRHVNWKPHIQKIVSKLSQFSYALRIIKRTTNLHTALTTYYAYAYAWLSYGILLWGSSTDAKHLFRSQKKLVRIIGNLKNDETCKPIFKSNNILTLSSIYILECCKFVKQHSNLFTKRSDVPMSHNLRNQNRLLLPASKLTLHATSPYVMCIKLFNKLPNDIKSINDLKNFTITLKKFLINKCYYDNNEYLNDNLA